MMLTVGGGAVTTATLAGSLLTGADVFHTQVFRASADSLGEDLPDFAAAFNALRKGVPHGSPDYATLAGLGWWASTIQFLAKDSITTQLRNTLSDIGKRAHALPSFSRLAAAVLRQVEEHQLNILLEKRSSTPGEVTQEGGAHTCVSHPFCFLTGGAHTPIEGLPDLFKSARELDEKIMDLLSFMGVYHANMNSIRRLGLVSPLMKALSGLAFYSHGGDPSLPLLAARALFVFQGDSGRAAEEPTIVMDAIRQAAKDPRNVPAIELALDGRKRDSLDVSTTALRLLRDEVLPRTYRSGHAEKTESVLSLSQRIHLNQRDNEDFDDLRFSPFGEDRLAKLLKINWQGDRVRLRKTAFDIFRTPGTTEERRVFALFAWFAARDTLPAESNMSERSFVGWEMVKWAVDFSQNLRGYVAAHLLNHLGPVEKPSGFLTSLYSTLRGRTDIDPFLQIQLIRAFRHQVEAQSRMARGELSELAWSLFDILESRDFPFAVRVMAYTEGRGVAKRLDPEGAEKAEEKAWKRLEKLLFKDFPFAARFGPREDSYGGAYLPGLLSFKKPDALHATAAYLNLEGAAGIVEELLEDMGIVKGARQNSPICFNFELLVARFPTMSWLERTWYRMIG